MWNLLALTRQIGRSVKSAMKHTHEAIESSAMALPSVPSNVSGAARFVLAAEEKA